MKEINRTGIQNARNNKKIAGKVFNLCLVDIVLYLDIHLHSTIVQELRKSGTKDKVSKQYSLRTEMFS